MKNSYTHARLRAKLHTDENGIGVHFYVHLGKRHNPAFVINSKTNRFRQADARTYRPSIFKQLLELSEIIHEDAKSVN